MNARFRELLPWYVNGSLSEADRQWVDDFLREHPQARAELLWHESLRDEIGANAPKVPETIGLARTLRLIDAERPTPYQRLLRWLGRLGVMAPKMDDADDKGSNDRGFALRPAVAFALMAVVVLQFGVIGGYFIRGDDITDFRSGKGQPVLDGPLLKVSFTREAKESDIRFALIAVQGQLVGGPGQLGDYYVRVAKGTEAAAQATLMKQAGVASAEPVPGLPARP